MKDIRVLDLSHCELSDNGVCEIIQELDSCSVNLEELNLSGNGIGKNFTYFNRYLEQLLHFLTASSRLSVLKLSHNNLRGNSVKEAKKKSDEQPVPWVDKLLNCLNEVSALKELDLSHNLLGRNFGP